VLPHLGFAPDTVNRILVWGLFGIGFDILFGYTGLLSFGQSAFFGTGGFVAAYLLTAQAFPNVMLALFIGTIVAAAVGYLVGLIALRRTGIYFAMITVAIAEVFFFVEFNPSRPLPAARTACPACRRRRFYLGFTTFSSAPAGRCTFLAVCYFVGIVIALRIVRSPVGAILSAIRDNPLRAQAVGHNIQGYKLTAFVIAAAYAGFAGGLLGVLQASCRPTPSPSTRRANWSCRPRSAAPARCSGRWSAPRSGCICSDFLQNSRSGFGAPGSWCSVSCSCCWSASCGAASSAGWPISYWPPGAARGRSGRVRSQSRGAPRRSRLT
jgi:ABC-type uncharacterized transport system permease subunit